MLLRTLCLAIMVLPWLNGCVAKSAPRKVPTLAQVLADSQPSDWHPLDSENTLYMELPAGRVIIANWPRSSRRGMWPM